MSWPFYFNYVYSLTVGNKNDTESKKEGGKKKGGGKQEQPADFMVKGGRESILGLQYLYI